ncbi:MAG: ATP-binding protein, partial [Myxococcota bacterium]
LRDLADRMETVLELVDLDGLSVAEREGVSILLYRQAPQVAVSMMLDESGAALAPDVFLGDTTVVPEELRSHPRASASDAARIRASLGALPNDTSVISAPYVLDDGSARVTLALPLDIESVGKATAILEIVLSAELITVEGVDTGKNSRVYLVDGSGLALSHPALPAGSDLSSLGPVADFLKHRKAGVSRYLNAGTTELAAFAPVSALGAAVVVSQPEAVAFAVAANMRHRVLFWLTATLLVVLGTGFYFAARLRRRLETLTDGARAFGRRELDRTIHVATEDELHELATTMNSMAGELSKSLQELEAWNSTLEERVDQRTRELKATQSQLMTQSKMAAIGQLGAGVAHEINNPLSGVLGFAQLLLRGLPADDPNRKSIEQIEKAAHRCREITLRLLRFSERTEETDAAQFPLNTVIEEAVQLTASSMRSGEIEVVVDLDPTATAVHGVRGEMSVALINLFSNARTAMPEGGTLEVTTRVVEERVRIDVRDSGGGIDPSDLPRIFEPFFTRKQQWTGVGLGLSVVYRIVTDMSGTIRVSDTGESGTTVTIELPHQAPGARASA